MWRRAVIHQAWLGIVLGDLYVPILGLKLKESFCIGPDGHFRFILRLGVAMFFFLEIVGNFPGRGVGGQTKGSFAGDVGESIAVFDLAANGKLRVLPPLVNQGEIPGFQMEIKVAETIVREQATVPKIGMGFVTSYPFE